ncbi:hypothetical protein Pd630_LPD10011 (plasmid) [Rhodococcus opacus PD630]|nr:hypothetical protein Pd630_LPD10011 [Rhodococcus opacus PD630]
MWEQRTSPVLASVSPAGRAVIATVAALLTMGSLPAVANAEPANPSEQSSVDSSDCGDVINLAVPGTWETNEAADRKTVPGMLAQITQPLEKALTNPSPLAERDPGSYRTPSAAATTTTASPSGSATKSQSPTTTTSASRSTKSAASPQNKVTARPVRVVSEQIPYVAQVGGPIAGVVTGNPMTLKQSKANGSAALEARATQLAKACPLAKFVILGYSQGSEIAGDFLSKVGNREGSIDPSRVLAGVLLSDPSRSPSTPDPEADAPVANPVKLSSVAETMIGPNVTGQGVLGTRDKGMGVLAERVTSFCAPNDSVCSLPYIRLGQEVSGDLRALRVAEDHELCQRARFSQLSRPCLQRRAAVRFRLLQRHRVARHNACDRPSDLGDIGNLLGHHPVEGHRGNRSAAESLSRGHPRLRPQQGPRAGSQCCIRGPR